MENHVVRTPHCPIGLLVLLEYVETALEAGMRPTDTLALCCDSDEDCRRYVCSIGDQIRRSSNRESVVVGLEQLNDAGSGRGASGERAHSH